MSHIHFFKYVNEKKSYGHLGIREKIYIGQHRLCGSSRLLFDISAEVTARHPNLTMVRRSAQNFTMAILRIAWNVRRKKMRSFCCNTKHIMYSQLPYFILPRTMSGLSLDRECTLKAKVGAGSNLCECDGSSNSLADCAARVEQLKKLSADISSETLFTIASKRRDCCKQGAKELVAISEEIAGKDDGVDYDDIVFRSIHE